MKMNAKNNLTRCLWVVTFSLGILATDASAIDIPWVNSGAGNWDDDSNWQDSFVPSFSSDKAIVNNGGTPQFDDSMDDVLIESFVLAEVAGTSGNFEMTGGNFFAGQMRFGEAGNATATVSGGTLEAGGNSLFIGGRESTGTGVLNVSGASTVVRSGDDFIAGRVGTGTFNLTGGDVKGVYTVVGKFGSGFWNQSGGLYRSTADLEIGDGGNPSQIGTSGPREGTINLSGGVLQVKDAIAIGNRSGSGIVNVSGGTLSATGAGNSTIFVGRGNDWGAGQGGDVELRVTGSAGTVIANGDFLMNPALVATSSTLIAEITGSDHTTIKVGGDADITNGSLSVELSGYSPVNGDSWTLIEAGADLTAEKTAITDFVATNEFEEFDHFEPSEVGGLVGNFLSLDLPEGFEISYTATEVILSFSQGIPGDFNDNDFVDGVDLLQWEGDYGVNGSSDADDDEDSDGADFLAWQRNFGSGTPPVSVGVTAVPEPSSLVLVGLSMGLSMLISRRKK